MNRSQTRILARRSAMQAIYQWQMTGYNLAEIERQFIEEHGLGYADPAYFNELLHEARTRGAQLLRRPPSAEWLSSWCSRPPPHRSPTTAFCAALRSEAHSQAACPVLAVPQC